MAQADEEMKGQKDPDADDVEAVARRKLLLHEVLVRNGLDVPCAKSTIATSEFLNDCFDGECFLFDIQDIRLRNCHSPPPVQTLQANAASTLQAALAANRFHKTKVKPVQRLLYYLERKQADKPWLLRFLGTLDSLGEHQALFAKDFVTIHPSTRRKV